MCITHLQGTLKVFGGWCGVERDYSVSSLSEKESRETERAWQKSVVRIKCMLFCILYITHILAIVYVHLILTTLQCITWYSNTYIHLSNPQPPFSSCCRLNMAKLQFSQLIYIREGLNKCLKFFRFNWWVGKKNSFTRLKNIYALKGIKWTSLN